MISFKTELIKNKISNYIKLFFLKIGRYIIGGLFIIGILELLRASDFVVSNFIPEGIIKKLFLKPEDTKNEQILFNLGISFVCSSIFYFFTVYVPRKQKEISFLPRVSYLFYAIYVNQERVLEKANRLLEDHNRDITKLTHDDYKNMSRKMFEIYSSSDIKKTIETLQYIIKYSLEIKSSLIEIMNKYGEFVNSNALIHIDKCINNLEYLKFISDFQFDNENYDWEYCFEKLFSYMMVFFQGIEKIKKYYPRTQCDINARRYKNIKI